MAWSIPSEVIAELAVRSRSLGTCGPSHGSPWVGETGEGFTTIAVEIREPVPEKAEVKHHVQMKDFRQWRVYEFTP